jgi:hypothetical protein
MLAKALEEECFIEVTEEAYERLGLIYADEKKHDPDMTIGDLMSEIILAIPMPPDSRDEIVETIEVLCNNLDDARLDKAWKFVHDLTMEKYEEDKKAEHLNSKGA